LKKINRTAELIFTFKILIKKNFAKFKAKKDVNRGLIIRISLLKSYTTKWFKSLKNTGQNLHISIFLKEPNKSRYSSTNLLFSTFRFIE
jgi:hypothetical protein